MQQQLREILLKYTNEVQNVKSVRKEVDKVKQIIIETIPMQEYTKNNTLSFGIEHLKLDINQ